MVGLTSLLLLLSLFLLFGGTTLERFQNGPESDHATPPAMEDYRVTIQSDALKVSLHSPLLGVGLGNFEPIFTSMRDASAGQNRTLHPESDWLWMAVEMGWFAPVLVLIGIKWWAGQCLPLTLRSGESLRRAALAAVVMFLLHGFVDVSGHRPGSLFVGVFMASLALSPDSFGLSRLPHPWIASLFRALALILGLLGSWWLASLISDAVPPTTATFARWQHRMNLAASEGRLASMAECANAALELDALDWTPYFRRASAEAFRTGATEKAVTDFQIARYLEPHWIDLCENEGEVWLAAGDSDRCLEAWQEALRRAGPKGTDTYTTLLGLAQDNPDVHHGLRKFATTNPDYLIAFLTFANREEEQEEIDALLSHDPNLRSLTPTQQEKLFATWYDHGDQDALAKQLLAHEEWQLAGWKFLAQHFASRQDFELASITALRYLRPPDPPPPSDQSPTVLENDFNLHPDDLAEGIVLCQSQIQHNQLDEALITISSLAKQPGCPHYIFYLQAQVYVKKQQWEAAWDALRQSGEV